MPRFPKATSPRDCARAATGTVNSRARGGWPCANVTLSMRAYDLIRKKRDGGQLSSEELQFLVWGATSGGIADEQLAAFLMAVFFRGMDAQELRAWLNAMLHSGQVLDLSGIPGRKVDKHSTGGV